jgi:hypothetical protein
MRGVLASYGGAGVESMIGAASAMPIVTVVDAVLDRPVASVTVTVTT